MSKQKEQDLNIKVIRLQSGEDIIADIISDGDYTILNNPMVVMVRRSPTGSVMMMSPWLPVEVISDNIASINNSEIVTTVNPRESLVEYYLTRVGETNEDIEKSDFSLNEYNASTTQDYLDTFLENNSDYEERYDEDETVDDLLNSLETPTDKKHLH
jgi:hypothetical protein